MVHHIMTDLEKEIQNLLKEIKSISSHKLDKEDYDLIRELQLKDEELDSESLDELLKYLNVEDIDDLGRDEIDLSGPKSRDTSVSSSRKKYRASSFAEAVLNNAKQDLNEGVYEDLGRNDGKRIREYFKHLNSASGQEWCAAAVTAWMKEAGGGPVQGSLGAQEVGRQFQAAKKWIPRDKIKPEDLTPGNIAVWSRGEPGSGKGHIGVISSSDDSGNFSSIEGNSGPQSNRVYENRHSINDSNLLGIGILSDYTDSMSAEDDILSFALNDSINKIYKISLRYEQICGLRK